MNRRPGRTERPLMSEHLEPKIEAMSTPDILQFMNLCLYELSRRNPREDSD